MLNKKTVAVVVPTYNEEIQIKVVIETMPDFVDRIVIVNDASTDKTAKVVMEYIKNDKKTATVLDGKKKIKPTKYNKADIVLEDMRDKEDDLFTPYKIWNEHPE